MKFSRKLRGMSKSLDSPVKILLADDSVTMHRAVSLALKKESYDLICVDNGKDALRLIYEHRPQIALLDLDMPEKTGIEVAQAIRDDATLSGTQIVLLCGSFDEVNEKDVEKAPVDARLWKPFESHVLLAMLRTLLNAKNTPSTRTQASESSEPTGPNTSKHKDLPPLPKFAPPKSRKDAAIERATEQVAERVGTVQGISPQKAEAMKKAVEETRPLDVKDLFDPAKKNAAPKTSIKAPPLPTLAADEEDSDFSKSLTRETFGASHILNEELPAPITASEEPTLPPQPKEDPFVGNLWDPEELSSVEERTEFSNAGLVENSLELNTYMDESAEGTAETAMEFEVISNQDALRTSAHEPIQAPDWLSRESSAPTEFDDLKEEATRIATDKITQAPEFAAYRADASPAGSLGAQYARSMHESRTNESASSSVSSSAFSSAEDIRKLVELEVRRVFQDWLHDELKRQLNEVMAELEDELH
jgi:CheY-like chemotaxis protein